MRCGTPTNGGHPHIPSPERLGLLKFQSLYPLFLLLLVDMYSLFIVTLRGHLQLHLPSLLVWPRDPFRWTWCYHQMGGGVGPLTSAQLPRYMGDLEKQSVTPKQQEQQEQQEATRTKI